MQFDFNVGANQSQHIDVVGTFLKYKSGTGTIRVRLNGGGYIDLMPGQGVNNVNFTSVDVQDRTGAQNVGTILAGMYDFRDDRITGSVEVIDGGRSRTNAGQAFTAHLYMSAVAAQVSAVQLYNPPGNTKNLVVNQIQGVISGGYSLQMKLLNSSIGGTAGNIGSKKAGGPATTATSSQIAPADGLSPISGATFAMSNGQILKLSEPFLIAPGWGLVLASPVQNNACGADIEFFEDSIL